MSVGTPNASQDNGHWVHNWSDHTVTLSQGAGHQAEQIQVLVFINDLTKGEEA